MNKYILLLLLNLPLLLVGILGAITSYKTSRISRNKCVVQVVSWLLVGIGLLCVEPVYNALIRNSLTDSPPLSLFDIALLSALLFCLLLIKQANEKIDLLGKKFSRMHENIVIAEEQRSWDKEK